jgi:serine protease AprX
MAATPVVSPQPRLGTGLGLLDASRGPHRVVADCNGIQTEIRGEIDVRCQAWNPAAWSGLSWKGDAWTGLSWKGSEWSGLSWKGVSWSDATWTGLSWKGGTWTSDSWQGSTSWNGGSTVTSAWTGLSWKSSTWTGLSWKSADWTTGEWTAGEYDEFLSAFWGNGPPPGRFLPGERFTPLNARPTVP